MVPIKRKLLTLIGCSLLLLIIVTAAIILLLRSENFSRYLVSRFTRFENHSLTVGQCQGSLLGGLTLKTIEYRYPGHRIAVEQANIDWRPFELLTGRLHLNTLAVNGLEYRSEQTSAALIDVLMAGFKEMALPFDVIVENAVIDDLEWRGAGKSRAFERLALKLTIDGKKLNLHHLDLDQKHLHINLRGQGELISPFPFQTEVRWMVRHAGDAPIRGKGDVRGNPGKMNVALKLYEPLVAGLNGELTLDRVNSDAYKLVFDGSMNGRHLPPAVIHATGQGGMQAFSIDALTAKCLGGTLALGGHVTRRSAIEWDLTISGTDIHPGLQWRLWPGKLDLNAALKGAFTDNRPRVEVSNIKVNGQLLERPFRASGNLRLNGKAATLEKLRLVLGDNRVALDGLVSEKSNLRVEFDLPDPYSLWTGFRGHVKGSAILAGDYRRPAATMSIDGANMAYGDYNLQQVDATVFIDAANPPLSTGDFRLHDFRVGKHHFPELTAAVSGDFQGHRARVDVASPATTISLGLNGSCIKDICEFTVDTASFDLRPHGAWRLQDPAHVTVRPDAIQSFDACWVKAKSRICLSSAWDEAGGWTTAGDTDAPALLTMLEMLGDIFDKRHLGWEKEAIR